MELAQKLRRNMTDAEKRLTDAEKRLWSQLRSKQLFGMKFRRQHPIGPFIVDFVCLEKKHVIEVDGGQHSKGSDKDLKRDEWLASEGYKVLRYWNDDVLKETKSVLEDVLSKIGDHPPPTPPLKGGGL
jgi:very-short-patch-repair endonuclease